MGLILLWEKTRLHSYLAIVVGTVVIFLAGFGLSWLLPFVRKCYFGKV